MADRRFDQYGIGFGGAVHSSGQRVLYSTHVSGWEDSDLVGQIERRFHVPAIIDRDTLLGSLGEGIHGAGPGMQSLF